jgi:hypothetical protein
VQWPGRFGQRLLEGRHGRIMDAPEGAGAGFRLTRRAAHNDARSTNLDNLELRRANVVIIEAASRPQPPGGHAGGGQGCSYRGGQMVKVRDQPIVDGRQTGKS